MQKGTFFSLILLQGILLTSSTSLASQQPEWNNLLNHDAIEARLQTEKIIHVEGLRSYFAHDKKKAFATNRIKMVTLESGLMGVFKAGEYSRAEVAAYKASKTLGLRLVPPTVQRTIDGKKGSLQFFVNSSLITNKKTLKKLDRKAISDMHIFYFVFGQWDNHEGNQVIAESNGNKYLALIDNAGILHQQHVKYGDFPFVGKGVDPDSYLKEPFPFEKTTKIYPRTYKAFAKLLDEYITKKEVQSLWHRKLTVPYIIWRNSLWMQLKKHSGLKPSHTKIYYQSTLMALEKLDYDSLLSIWSVRTKKDSEWYEELITLILKRRNELLHEAYIEGTIIEDRAPEPRKRSLGRHAKTLRYR